MPDRTRLLELALKGLAADRAKIDDEIAEIKSQMNPGPAVTKSGEAESGPTTAPRKKKRTMSAEAKRKISEAMKRRYAATRSKEEAEQDEPNAPRLTAAGRK